MFSSMHDVQDIFGEFVFSHHFFRLMEAARCTNESVVQNLEVQFNS